MSAYHCSCGFAINDPREFADHLLAAFDHDTGTDGRAHAEIITGDERETQTVCACGFRADDGAELDDHLLLALTPSDSVGTDGERHVLVDPSTPDRWYIRRKPTDNAG